MSKLSIYILMGVVVMVVVGAVLAVPQFRQFLPTQVARNITLQKTVKITIPEGVPPGEHTFSINVKDNESDELLIASEPLTIVVENIAKNNDSGGADEGSGGGGGGGDSGGGDGNAPSTPAKTFAFAPERGHEISGKEASVINDSGKVVVKLGANKDSLEKTLKVPKNDYWLYLEAKHGSPAPIKVAVYINNKSWKVVTLDKGDNLYRVHRVGLLRGFSGGKVRFRLVNDEKKKSGDRAFLIDAWALSTSPNLKSVKAPVGKGAIKGSKTKGEYLLPRLNQITREELGKKFVKWDIWSYYAQRLAATPSRRRAIGTEDRLREVMRFWKLASPHKPRGE